MRHGVLAIREAINNARKIYAEDTDGDKNTTLEAMATLYSDECEKN